MDLGERLETAFKVLLKNHTRAVVIGTDSPLLSRRAILIALEELRASDAVLGPCADGGFYLIGLRRSAPGLFDNMRWGSEWAFEDMRNKVQENGISCRVLASIEDVDRPEDVERLKDVFLSSAMARRQSPSTWRFIDEFFALNPLPSRRKKEKPNTPISRS
ncbi:MAG: TIGR04282 family arsenosugar biosynthesis glycosyltransferase [Deltaproteobacteria bacterium]